MIQQLYSPQPPSYGIHQVCSVVFIIIYLSFKIYTFQITMYKIKLIYSYHFYSCSQNPFVKTKYFSSFLQFVLRAVDSCVFQLRFPDIFRRKELLCLDRPRVRSPAVHDGSLHGQGHQGHGLERQIRLSGGVRFILQDQPIFAE